MINKILMILKILSLSLLIYKLNFSQNSFVRTYYDLNCKLGDGIIQTADSGFVIIGATNENRAILIKTDKSGDTLWTKVYGNTQTYPNEKYAVKIISNENYLIGFGNSLIRTDKNGDIIWEKTIEYATVLAVNSTLDSCLLVTGFYYENNWNFNLFLMKMDNDGDTIWTKKYKVENEYWGKSNCAIQTMDRGYILAGHDVFVDTNNHNENIYKIVVIKTNEVGDTI